MAPDDSADEICRRMAELRRDLSCNVQEVSRKARTMTDWTFYVRRFPWAVAALAVGAGFLLVPRKKQVIKPDSATIAEMVKNKQIRVEARAPSKEEQGMMKSLLMMGITWGARAGVQYMGERMRAAAAQNAHGSAGAPHAAETQTQPTGDGHAKQPR